MTIKTTLALAGVLLLVAVTTYFVTYTPSAERVLPAPTGTFGVGRAIFHWIDADRREILSTRPGDNREVGIWLWYPASARQPALETAPYVEKLDVLAEALTRREVSLARSVRTHTVGGADVAPEPATYPILLFSPGAATIPALYTSFSEELASHGYVVAVLDHPYDNGASLLSDGRVVKPAQQPDAGEELLAFQRERVSVRAQDIAFVIRQLELFHAGAIESPFRGRLDLGRIGVLGHSIGGMTAAEACINDASIQACANMDGVVSAMPAYPDLADRGPSQPLLFMAKPFPAIRGEAPEDFQRRLAFLHARGNALLDDVQFGRSYRVTVIGATHATFSDEEVLLAGRAEGPRELLGYARAYLLAFFDENLRGQRPALLDSRPPSSAIQVEVFTPQ
jgi:dienelactone hydrolase